MRISDWSSDVCSSDLVGIVVGGHETFDLGDPEIFEHLNPQMAIEEGIPARVLVIGCHGRRLYEPNRTHRSEEHTSELQSLMRISYAVFCLKKNNNCH